MTCIYKAYTLKWRGLVIEVRYTPNWLPSSGKTYDTPLAHLEVKTLEPNRSPLPITSTGYRSHFLSSVELEGYEDPAAFVREWLDEQAAKKEWCDLESKANQYSLF